MFACCPGLRKSFTFWHLTQPVATRLIFSRIFPLWLPSILFDIYQWFRFSHVQGAPQLTLHRPSDSASRHSLEAPRRSCPVWGAPSLYSKAASLVEKQKPGCRKLNTTISLKTLGCRWFREKVKERHGKTNVSGDRFTVGVAKHWERNPTRQDILNVKYAMKTDLHGEIVL